MMSIRVDDGEIHELNLPISCEQLGITFKVQGFNNVQGNINEIYVFIVLTLNY